MCASVMDLRLPLSAETARGLELGQMVTVSGAMFTGRSRFHIRAIQDNVLPPIRFDEINAFFHVGPVMRQEAGQWQVVSCEPTSSIRFERYGPDVVRRLKLRALLGKTTMGPGTAKALAEVGGVHLSKIGLCGNALARQIKRVRAGYFVEELGKTEATWVFEVERFGPFFVDMDARGANYFEDLDQAARERMAAELERMGVARDYAWTSVSGEG